MNKLLLFICTIAILSSCAENKTFRKSNGDIFVAEPYGWMNRSKRIDGVMYDVNVGNMLLNFFRVETVIVPALLTGLELYEPT